VSFWLPRAPPDDVVSVQQQQPRPPTLVQADDDDECFSLTSSDSEDRAISHHAATHLGPIGSVCNTRVSFFFVHEYPLQHLVAGLAVKVFIVFNRLDMPVSVLFPSRAAALLSTPSIKHKVHAPASAQ
jgi:hypothetical protein